MQTRSLLIRAIRDHFHSAGFIETDTPAMVFSPGMEPHIRPIGIAQNAAFLITSPEFAMKRILAAPEAPDKIFQICKSWRNEPFSQTHHPEFTMLEWYRSHSDYEAIMDDVEALFESISQKLFTQTDFISKTHGPQNLSRPWLRLTIEECFRKFAGLELTTLFQVEAIARVCVERGLASNTDAQNPNNTWDDFFFRIMLNLIEPALEKLGRPVILYHYPTSQAALSRITTDARGFKWARRFEVYAGGLELGNAFDELTDPKEQRHRFEKDMQLRKKLYGDTFPPNPIDEDFLNALNTLPPTGGIAMGVDRLVQYFTGSQSIDEVTWLKPYFSPKP